MHVSSNSQVKKRKTWLCIDVGMRQMEESKMCLRLWPELLRWEVNGRRKTSTLSSTTPKLIYRG